jgi:sortase A
MKKLLSRILIIAGIIIITVPIYLNYKSEKINDEMIKIYEDEKLEIPENMMGIIEIPSIDIKVAIQEGTDMKTLKYAIGHFENTAYPGEVGNFALAGHRAYTSNTFFSDLDKVKLGDNIKIITRENEFNYEVISTEVVLPTQVEVLDNVDDKKLITLVTCTPKYTGTHRLIIKGELKE